MSPPLCTDWGQISVGQADPRDFQPCQISRESVQMLIFEPILKDAIIFRSAIGSDLLTGCPATSFAAPAGKQEAQLMLTNPSDAFRGQSRSPNMVPFDMLGMVSY